VYYLRQEPVLFLTTEDGDFAPYSLREQDKLRRLFLVNFTPAQADEHEARIRKEVRQREGFFKLLLINQLIILLIWSMNE
jgi:hypothetical protein